MKKLIHVIPFLLSIVLVFHFLTVLLSVSPYNPITHKTSNFVNSYINPMFSQTWTLFAPDPVHTNDVLQVKLGFSKGEVTNWIDTTTPIVDNMHKNYFSPYNRIGRLTGSITSQMLTEDEMIHNLRNKYNEQNEEHKIKELDKYYENSYKVYEQYLLRYGSSYAASLYPIEDIESIEMRILRQDSIPFSQREDIEEVDWRIIANIEKQPIISNVAPLM